MSVKDALLLDGAVFLQIVLVVDGGAKWHIVSPVAYSAVWYVSILHFLDLKFPSITIKAASVHFSLGDAFNLIDSVVGVSLHFDDPGVSCQVVLELTELNAALRKRSVFEVIYLRESLVPKH